MFIAYNVHEKQINGGPNVVTIKEVEEKTGLTRSSIRFYEKEHLIDPKRDKHNRYRDYTETDAENLKKIAYLRTLGISIENIRKIISHEIELLEVIEKQYDMISYQMDALKTSQVIFRKMINTGGLTYDNLNIEKFVPKVKDYWDSNHKLLKLDSINFMYIWGSVMSWSINTALTVLIALLAFPHLPEQIPIQWSHGTVTNEVGKIFIFAYPAACILIRFLLRPFIWKWLNDRFLCTDMICNYVTNCLCFTALTIQLITILYVNGFIKNIPIILTLEFVILIGILVIGFRHIDS